MVRNTQHKKELGTWGIHSRYAIWIRGTIKYNNRYVMNKNGSLTYYFHFLDLILLLESQIVVYKCTISVRFSTTSPGQFVTSKTSVLIEYKTELKSFHITSNLL